MRLIIATAVYITAVVAANILSARYGMVPVLGTSLIVSAGTYAAGFALLARDFVHRYGGPRVAVAAVLAAGALSWVMASPGLAAASTVAFLTAESVDLLVFHPLRTRRGFVPAALVSNLVSAPVDTFVFLWLSGFGITTAAVSGQLVGKLVWATAVPLALYAAAAAYRWRRLEARA